MKVYDISNDFKEVSPHWKPGTNYYWIVCDARDIDYLAKKIPLDNETLEECKNKNQSAKICVYESYLFIIFNILELNNDEIISRELNIYLGKDYIITIYKDQSPILENLLQDINQGKDCFILKESPRPCILLYYILDRIIVRNYNIISDLEAEADDIEIKILKSPNEEHARRLINLRRQVYKIRKFLNPLRYIGDSLNIIDYRFIEAEYLKYFESINKKIDKLMQAQDMLVQDLALVREAYESEISNKTNEIMKVFTIVAAVFLPIEIITGLFGMSFNHIPLKNEVYGFYFIVAVMVPLVLFLISVFKNKKWL
ncbi:magnesium transporter CorA family protein [Clostridium thermarum]|uniref:magnesium transporter CorA family protein n=1 Tax=Clostridium thermarum TaxID=1716543 RepID=UPI0013D1B9A4|nr:magnesium transporter CorA family protein [Clostridium thermarum]